MLASPARGTAWRGPTYVSVAGVDGLYADALGNVFRASRVSAKAGEARNSRREDESRGGFSRLPELHVGRVVSAGRSQYTANNGGWVHKSTARQHSRRIPAGGSGGCWAA